MRQFNYTEDWFTSDGLSMINKLDENDELHFLEIGSFEGKSTIWFLDNFLQTYLKEHHQYIHILL